MSWTDGESRAGPHVPEGTAAAALAEQGLGGPAEGPAGRGHKATAGQTRAHGESGVESRVFWTTGFRPSVFVFVGVFDFKKFVLIRVLGSSVSLEFQLVYVLKVAY